MRRFFISLAVLSLLVLVSCQKKIADPVLVSERPYQAVKVVRVINGDTFVAIVEGKEERCRILYIDTPERGEPGFDEATEFLIEHLAAASQVNLYSDTRGTVSRDRYGRLLVDVKVGGREPESLIYLDDVGLLLIREGWSPYYTKYGRASSDSEYREAEVEAKKAKRGIWANE